MVVPATSMRGKAIRYEARQPHPIKYVHQIESAEPSLIEDLSAHFRNLRRSNKCENI
jgi:hypothetical protein